MPTQDGTRAPPRASLYPRTLLPLPLRVPLRPHALVRRARPIRRRRRWAATRALRRNTARGRGAGAAWRGAVEAAAARDSDDAAEVLPAASMAMVLVASSSPPVKKPRILSSQIGEVFGSLCRVESSVDAEDAEVDANPDFAGVAEAVPTPSWTPVAASHADDEGGGGILAPEAAAEPAPTSPSSPAPAPTANGLFVAPAASVQTPPSTPVAASASAPAAAPTNVTQEKRAVILPATMPLSPASAARRAAAPFRRLPLPQLVDDAFERADRLKRRFSSLIAKSQETIDERYREDLRSRRVAPDPQPAPEPEPQPEPEPEPEPVVDDEKLRRMAVIQANRRRFRGTLRRAEVQARQDALFMTSARTAHLRALGIDAAMERVVSPDRPRGVDGSPIVSRAHPPSPVEKLGFFLKSP